MDTSAESVCCAAARDLDQLELYIAELENRMCATTGAAAQTQAGQAVREHLRDKARMGHLLRGRGGQAAGREALLRQWLQGSLGGAATRDERAALDRFAVVRREMIAFILSSKCSDAQQLAGKQQKLQQAAVPAAADNSAQRRLLCTRKAAFNCLYPFAALSAAQKQRVLTRVAAGERRDADVNH